MRSSQWWPRPLQIVQWTFSAAPLHPILIDAVRRVHHTTALIESRRLGVDSSKSNSTEERWVGGELLRDDGTVSIMEWTGPGLFTDSVIRYVWVCFTVYHSLLILNPDILLLNMKLRGRD